MTSKCHRVYDRQVKAGTYNVLYVEIVVALNVVVAILWHLKLSFASYNVDVYQSCFYVDKYYSVSRSGRKRRERE